MSRILTGIQSSGRPHLGNVLGAILPAIQLVQHKDNEGFFFIADLHAIISIKDPEIRKENTYAVAAAWLSFGLDTNKNVFYRQSRVTEVCELMWYLNCLTPYPMLANAHSFKDKADKLADVNGGLFTYPVLMAGDIIMYDADVVPVGKDQKQHLEMTRDIANIFNKIYGEVFVVPRSKINETLKIIPGTDGQKMSKSYGNTIDIFASDRIIKKQVMGIFTDAKTLEEPKDPEHCNVFAMYQLLGTAEQTVALEKKYRAGNYGYGHAKNELLALINQKYNKQRAIFNRYMDNIGLLEEKLQAGEAKARKVARKVLSRVRNKIGLL